MLQLYSKSFLAFFGSHFQWKLLSHKSWWIIWVWKNNCHNICLLCPLDLSGWFTRLDVNVVYYFLLTWTLPLTNEIFKLLSWICMPYFTVVLRNQNKNPLVFLCLSISVYVACAGADQKIRNTVYLKNQVTISELVHNTLWPIDFRERKYSVTVLLKELSRLHGLDFKIAASRYPLSIQFQTLFCQVD